MRPSATSGRPREVVVVVAVVVLEVVVLEKRVVLVVVLEGVVVHRHTVVRARKLSLEGRVVSVRAEVLQLPSHFRLLGLLTAAPHGVDPLIRRSGAGALGGAPDVVVSLSCPIRYIVHWPPGILTACGACCGGSRWDVDPSLIAVPDAPHNSRKTEDPPDRPPVTTR